MSSGSKYNGCIDRVRGGQCCLGSNWRIFCRTVCDGVEMYCAIDGEEGDVPAEDLAARFGAPEALEGY